MTWAAIILGFTGSLHCLGMCSPLIVSVTSWSSRAFLSRLVYNTGRVMMYGVMGAVMASMGLVFPLLKYQNIVSVATGVILLVLAFTKFSFRIPFVTAALSKFSIGVKAVFSQFLKRKNYASMFLLGGLNGILPCGLSFLALTYSLTSSGPAEGFLHMIFFGVGTLPVMLGFTVIFKWAIERLHFKPQAMAATMLVCSGLFLIGRVFIVHMHHLKLTQEHLVDVVLCR